MFCSQCGYEYKDDTNFCASCGHDISDEGEDILDHRQPRNVATLPSGPNERAEVLGHRQSENVATLPNRPDERDDILDHDEPANVVTLPNRISIQRVLLMTALTYGLYLFYWFSITWKQYRDHTGDTAYPVWHSLTLLVPIYSLFRMHAHSYEIKRMVSDAGVPNSISPAKAVVLLIVANMLVGIGIGVNFARLEDAPLTLGMAVFFAALDVGLMVVLGWLILEMQDGLNRFWGTVQGINLDRARIGVGESIFVFLGLLSWLSTISSLTSESYRLGL